MKKKIHAYVSYKHVHHTSLLFMFPSHTKKNVTCVGYKQHIFLSFLYKSSKKSFLRETFSAHLEPTKYTCAHFFRIFCTLRKYISGPGVNAPCPPWYYPLLHVLRGRFACLCISMYTDDVVIFLSLILHNFREVTHLVTNFAKSSLIRCADLDLSTILADLSPKKYIRLLVRL